MRARDLNALRTAPLETPTDIKPNAVREISGALNIALADLFALYVKTKNFYWHMSGPHFRDYHLLLDEQEDQIFAATDAVAERGMALDRPTCRGLQYVRRGSWRSSCCFLVSDAAIARNTS